MEKQINTYEHALQVSSWADLFGFQYEAGRDGDTPFVIVEGVKYEDKDADHALVMAAKAMGMGV